MNRGAIAVVVFMLGACQADQTLKPLHPPPPPSGENHPPRAQLSVSAEALEGTPLTFNSQGSDDDDGDQLVFTLSFGDGDSTLTAESTVSHTYRNDGSYTARLIVHDLRGAADTAVATIHVVNVAPQITRVRIPEFAVGGGIPAQIDVQYSDPGLDDSLRASISFILSGSVARYAPLSRPGITTQTFLDPGQYGVRVTVQDGDGATTQLDAAQTLDVVGRYEMLELGTLGGSGTMPVALNDSGYVVGCSATSDGESHAFRWRYGNMRDLAPGADESCAHTLTNSGVVGGILRSGADRHVVTWTTAGALTDFGVCCGIGRDVVALTNSELVVSGWDGHSFFLQGGVTRNLGGLGDSGYAAAKAMNNRRQIVGASLVAEDGINRIDHAFIWENGVMRDLGLLGDPLCPDSVTRCGRASAVRINNDGVVIGMSTDATGESRGVQWINGRIEDLGFPNPKALNSRGDVAGNGPYPAGGNPDGGEGFFWRSGITRSIGSLGGGTTFVADMNDAGMIVASSYTSGHSMHVAVWNPTDGRLVDLGTGPAVAGATGAQAIAINARGDVLGLTVGQCLESIDDPNYRCIQYDGPKRAVVWRKKA